MQLYLRVSTLDGTTNIICYSAKEAYSSYDNAITACSSPSAL